VPPQLGRPRGPLGTRGPTPRSEKRLTGVLLADPIQRESTMDSHHFVHFPRVLSGELPSRHAIRHHLDQKQRALQFLFRALKPFKVASVLLDHLFYYSLVVMKLNLV
jgi:hypothetical protein